VLLLVLVRMLALALCVLGLMTETAQTLQQLSITKSKLQQRKTKN
jgi:hypothetical protein